MAEAGLDVGGGRGDAPAELVHSLLGRRGVEAVDAREGRQHLLIRLAGRAATAALGGAGRRVAGPILGGARQVAVALTAVLEPHLHLRRRFYGGRGGTLII